MAVIADEGALRALYKPVHARAVAKQLDRLDPHCRRFISLAPFVILATSDAQGRVDASPRGDAPGFVQVQDGRTVLLPDWPGNNRLDSLKNILSSPRVGLLFLVPGIDETLRVNGRAVIDDDQDLRARFDRQGRQPATVMVVQVEEVFFHCAKALMRSGLWDPARQIERATFPSIAEIIRDQTGTTGRAETQPEMIERYKETLY